jgi:hypothetical protein
MKVEYEFTGHRMVAVFHLGAIGSIVERREQGKPSFELVFGAPSGLTATAAEFKSKYISV